MSQPSAHPPPMLSTKQVRFTDKDELIETVANDTPSPTPSNISSCSLPTISDPFSESAEHPLLPSLNKMLQVQAGVSNSDNLLTVKDTLYKEQKLAPPMSPSMLAVRDIAWDIHGLRMSSAYDSACATLSKSATEIPLFFDLLHLNAKATPAPMDTFITVGRVYDVIRDVLGAQIPVNSALFSNQDSDMKRAIWETSRQRSQNQLELSIKFVQYMDFLLEYYIVVGIFVPTGSECWVVKFGKLNL